MGNTRPFSAYNTHVLNIAILGFLDHKMSSGFHNRNKKDRRDSPSASNRPRSNSKASSENQRNRTPPKNNINGKMPSVASSPASTEALVDAMASLALENLKYVVGSRILAKMDNGLSVKGEIIAYEPKHKIVMIKSPGTRSGLNTVELVNLTHCVDITVEEEAQTAPGEMPGLNTQKLDGRLRDTVEKKKRLITAFKAGISPEGQRLFQAINKTLDEVSWNGDKIVVLREVTIDPPYRPENIRGKEDNKALKYVRQIVEKHISDQEAAKGGSPSTAPSSMSSSVTSVDSAVVTTASATAPTTSKSPPTTITTTIPNLPQAPAPPSKSGSGSNRSNRNNPGDRGGGGGRNKHGGGGHDGHYSKSMYSN